MRYAVILPKKAQKDLARIDGRYRQRILLALAALESNPHIGKKLTGELSGLRSYEIWPYRIIYEVNDGRLLVIVIRVGHRQGV